MICARCDRPIVGDAVRLDRSGSMSGARPDDWTHLVGDAECRVPRELRGASPLSRALRRTSQAGGIRTHVRRNVHCHLWHMHESIDLFAKRRA